MLYRASDVWKMIAAWQSAARRMFFLVALLLAGTMAACAHGIVTGPPFNYATDTFDFANQTVYLYPNGYAEKRQLRPGEKPPAFTVHCFAMCRATEQFRQFARFDPSLPKPDDETLEKRVRQVTRHAVWRDPLPPEKRIVIPGYANLRALSKAKPLILQNSLGWGWLAYLRPGNYRMFAYMFNGPRQQAYTQRLLEDSLRRNDLFVGYLTDFPGIAINHAIVIYGRRPATKADRAAGLIHYLVYDPNHADGPRDMAYDTRRHEFLFQKDWDFVGGRVTMLQVYNHPVQ